MELLNCCGLPCPQPVLRCRDFLVANTPESVAVLVDNEAASINVRRFLEQRGFRVDTSRDGTSWRLAAVKTGEAATGTPDIVPEDLSCSISDPSGFRQGARKIVVLIPSEVMGNGDDVLGGKLMENFLLTLPELEPELWRVILLNSGVKLAARQGASLEYLQRLAEKGVEVLVCGTCLAHFGLSEQKAVGETSNMLDIVTSMGLADLVIRP